MLVDTGAFCNCVSSKFFKKWLHRTTSLSPKNDNENFSTANNSNLDVLGSIRISVKIGGCAIPAKFFVVNQLSQDVVLGIPFFQANNAVIDLIRKRLSLHDGSITVPMLTSIDCAKCIRTVNRIKIPANHEVILPVRLPNLPGNVGITETLPHTMRKGIKVASALVDCDNKMSLCRVANPTRRPIFWPANYAFAHLSPLPATSGAGVNLIDVSDCFENDKTETTNDRRTQNNAYTGETRDDERVQSYDREPPPCHQARLSELHRLGIKIGLDNLNQNQAERLSRILYDARDIMAENVTQVPEARVPRHTIPLTDTRPSIQKRFRYDPVKEQKLETLRDELLAAGIIKPSHSLWNSPVFLITKPDGSSRFLVDFRAVNAKTEPLFCALPHLDDIFDQISEEKPSIFSVLDMKCGYYGIGIEEASQPCTSFSTKNRHFQFTRLNMGYVNSGAFFTQSLYKIFAAEVRRNMIIYVDDIFIMHRDIDEHLNFLAKILAKFRQYNLRLHPKKMNIATSSATFLGFTLQSGGYTVDNSRCKIVKEYKRPRNAKEVKRFLGIASYFRRVIKNYSKRSAPLRELMAKDKVFEWTDRQELSFCDIRDTLCSAPVLGYPDRNKPFRVVLDGSCSGLGYILLNVNEDGSETALYYGGRSTTRVERNYSATHLELAALLAALQTFWSYLINTEFEIVTDHISLTYLKKLRSGPSKLARASVQLSQFKFRVIHLAGKANSAADSISRTEGLEPDPLTVLEADRHQDDTILDLRLDCAADDVRDASVQCDLLKPTDTNGNDKPRGDAEQLDDRPVTQINLYNRPCATATLHDRNSEDSTLVRALHSSLALMPQPQRGKRPRAHPTQQDDSAAESADRDTAGDWAGSHAPAHDRPHASENHPARAPASQPAPPDSTRTDVNINTSPATCHTPGLASSNSGSSGHAAADPDTASQAGPESARATRGSVARRLASSSNYAALDYLEQPDGPTAQSTLCHAAPAVHDTQSSGHAAQSAGERHRLTEVNKYSAKPCGPPAQPGEHATGETETAHDADKPDGHDLPTHAASCISGDGRDNRTEQTETADRANTRVAPSDRNETGKTPTQATRSATCNKRQPVTDTDRSSLDIKPSIHNTEDLVYVAKPTPVKPINITSNELPVSINNVLCAVTHSEDVQRPGQDPAGNVESRSVDEHGADNEITLHTQNQDPVLARLIRYLQDGTLPDENNLARRILLTSEQYIIRDNQLLHLATRRQKNNETGQPIIEQLCIPRDLQSTLLSRYHTQLMHAGYERQYLSMRERIYWDGLYTDVRNYVSNCETCHLSKSNKHPVKAKLQCREVPCQIFERIHIDHVKIPVKGTKHGFNYALVMIDALSLCCEIAPVKGTSAAETCRVLLKEWIARYGVFSELVTDRHASFTGTLTRLLTEWCGIRHVVISPYHSRSNGQVEKMHSMVLQGLRIHCKNMQDWPKMLAPISAAYRSAVVPNRGYSPYKLMYGIDMRLPVETGLIKLLPAHTRQTENAETLAKQLTLMRAQAQQSTQASRQRAGDAANKYKHTPDFEIGQRVYKVKDALGDAEDHKTAMKFEDPFVIVDRGPNNVYKLRHIYTGKVLKNYIFVDKLKSAQSARATRSKRQTITAINRQECKRCGSTDGWLTRVIQGPTPPRTRHLRRQALRRQAPATGKRHTTGYTTPKVRL